MGLKKRVAVLSDINFDSYQHINQYLKIYAGSDYSVDFYSRVPIRTPRLSEVLRRLFERNKGRRQSNKKTTYENNFDLPILPPYGLLRGINKLILQFKLPRNYNSYIIFAAHPDLWQYLEKFRLNYSYYCVHNLLKIRDISARVYHAEKQLIIGSKTVFIDNVDVLEIFRKECNRTYRLIPPPVPEEFFKIPKKYVLKYKYVYFGSLHKDIDFDVIRDLANKDSFLYIGKDAHLLSRSKYLTTHPLITDMAHLGDLITSAEYIVLPYLNNDFMSTVSPAKVFQAKVLSEKVLTTSLTIAKKYGLIFYDQGLLTNYKKLEFNKEEFRVTYLVSKILAGAVQ